jgi:hypothetical protein
MRRIVVAAARDAGKRSALFDSLLASSSNDKPAPINSSSTTPAQALAKLTTDLQNLQTSNPQMQVTHVPERHVEIAFHSPLRLYRVGLDGSMLTLTTPTSPSQTKYAWNGEAGQWLSVKDGHDMVGFWGAP